MVCMGDVLDSQDQQVLSIYLSIYLSVHDITDVPHFPPVSSPPSSCHPSTCPKASTKLLFLSMGYGYMFFC